MQNEKKRKKEGMKKKSRSAMLVAKPIAAITIDLYEQYKKKKKNKRVPNEKEKKKAQTRKPVLSSSQHLSVSAHSIGHLNVSF